MLLHFFVAQNNYTNLQKNFKIQLNKHMCNAPLEYTPSHNSIMQFLKWICRKDSLR